MHYLPEQAPFETARGDRRTRHLQRYFCAACHRVARADRAKPGCGPCHRGSPCGGDCSLASLACDACGTRWDC